MDELVKRIDPHFAYEWHEIEDGIMRVYVRSTRKDAQCPYCGSISKQVHSVYLRKFRDLPIQGMKVEIVIRNRKFVMKTTTATGHDRTARLMAGKIEKSVCQADTGGESGVQPRACSLFKYPRILCSRLKLL